MGKILNFDGFGAVMLLGLEPQISSQGLSDSEDDLT